MNNEQKYLLDEKRKELQMKLNARDFVNRKIIYHWKDIFENIKIQGVKYKIESLCVVSSEMHPYILTAIDEMAYPEFSHDLIRVGNGTKMDAIFDKYPSMQPLKYIPDLPVLAVSDQLNLVFNEASQLLKWSNEDVYFFSPDWWPVLQLNWKDVLEHGSDLFSNIPLPFIFTDMSGNKILYKSIEDEWRITKSFEKT